MTIDQRWAYLQFCALRNGKQAIREVQQLSEQGRGLGPHVHAPRPLLLAQLGEHFDEIAINKGEKERGHVVVEQVPAIRIGTRGEMDDEASLVDPSRAVPRRQRTLGDAKERKNRVEDELLQLRMLGTESSDHRPETEF